MAKLPLDSCAREAKLKAPRWSYALNIALTALLLLGVVRSLWLRSRTPDTDYWGRTHFEARSDLFERLGVPDNSLVFLGDSLTERADWNELLGRHDAVNRGIGGDTVPGLLSRLAPVLRARPKTIVLLIGINDLDRGAKPEAVAADLETLLARLRAELPQTVLIVQSVLPMRDVGRGVSVAQASVSELNGLLVEACRQHQARYLDLQPALVDREGALDAAVTKDGIHLNGEGYLRWAALLSAELPKVNPAR